MISNFKIGQPVCFLLSLILNPSHNCVYIASLFSRPPSDNPLHGMVLRPCVMQHFIPAPPEALYSTVAPSPSQLSKFINLAALRGCKLRSNSSISIMSCFYSFLHTILPSFIDFLYLWLPIYHCITLYRIVSYISFGITLQLNGSWLVWTPPPVGDAGTIFALYTCLSYLSLRHLFSGTRLYTISFP